MLLKLLILTTAVLTVTAQLNLTPFGTASQSSIFTSGKGEPENAVNPPISNYFDNDLTKCTHTYSYLHSKNKTAWWMFEFSFDTAYITDITLYYREKFAHRMSGFKLYVANTSTIPPDGYLCYADPGTDLPNINQSIPCYQIGQYVIYFDDIGSKEDNRHYGPIVELCYVAINGCPKKFWGSNCSTPCSKDCIDQHCYPGNGSCVWGCNCINSICNVDTLVCSEGCMENRTGRNCNKYNLAADGLVSLNSTRSHIASQINNGNISSCSKIYGPETWIQIDIKERSFVSEIFLVIGDNTTKEVNHTIYASNITGSRTNRTLLYSGNITGITDIMIDNIFRYLIYELSINDDSEVEVCEIGIVGCPPTQFGLLCTKLYPVNCSGPCHLETGHCTYGCLNGWIGDTCEFDPECYHRVEDNYVVKCLPEIYKVNPLSGPVNGGTLVTIIGQFIGNVHDSISVDFDGLRCNNVTVQTPHSNLTCLTEKSNASTTTIIHVSVNGNTSNSNNFSFTFKDPEISKFAPKKGILSGGTIVTITGRNISFEGNNRYNIWFYDNTTRIECSSFRNTISSENIKCKTGISLVSRNMSRLQVVIDDLTLLTFNDTFRYLPDPTFTLSNESVQAQQSGGATFTIRGKGFKNVEKITVDRVDKPCDVPEDTSAVCETPPKLKNQNNSQTVYVRLDGVTLPVTIEYVDDPTFEKFSSVYEYDKESKIKIKGANILNGAQPEDYSIQIGLDGSCINLEITMQLITCLPPKSVPRTNQTDINTVYVIVFVGRIKAYIGDLKYQEDVKILAIIVGVLAAALVTAVVIGISAVVFLRKKKKRVMKEFKMELMTREEMIRKASREEFADAQMNIKDIKSDLVTTRVPFCDYQTYVLHLLFPNQDIKSNPLLHDSETTDDKKTRIKSAMEKFEILLSNKLFLKSLVQTLDRPNMLTMQEKAHFSSVLSISLLGNMRLFFELVHCLLVDIIRASTKKQQKSLLRRLDSITMRLMVNWLQTGLYKQLTSHSGMQLFMLYKAVQTIIEMAPIDALTTNSKNTIAEEKLLKMRIEHQTITLQIDLNGNSDQHYPVKVLDCDTISQVKQKCCAQIYKNKPASEIPHNDELSLEWQEGRSGKLMLNDIDNTSDRNNGLICLNTLKHYIVSDNCRMALMYKHQDEEDVYANSSECRTERVTSEDITLLVSGSYEGEDSETHKWHLETCSPNLPDDIKSNRETDFGDIFLNRLFHTKLLLSDYIDSTFEGLIDSQSLSISIRYFLCMLDKFGNDYKIESAVLQAWKNECYATRVWAPLIGKPNILFDVNVPGHVEPCLDILRQVFVESFTQTANKVNKESPPQKLLFHKDIPRYRKLIAPFFIRVEPVNDEEFWSEIKEISNTQKAELKFSRQSTLHHLYNLFIGKYKSEIIDDFEDMEEGKDLQFANKLEEVIDLMEEFSSDF
ncbi:plexin-B1-like isoform X9 [Mytilus californianus]|uniref:plexin-B1-like isoform X9 n=1 Tax=Mytilus californianus TaxID=6549 RepID=UPI00224628DA|nr:plexin-B1-like isoform X9 [Mytilus californianus]